MRVVPINDESEWTFWISKMKLWISEIESWAHVNDKVSGFVQGRFLCGYLECLSCPFEGGRNWISQLWLLNVENSTCTVKGFGAS